MRASAAQPWIIAVLSYWKCFVKGAAVPPPGQRTSFFSQKYITLASPSQGRKSSCALTSHRQVYSINDPARPPPPAAPFYLSDADEPDDKSLVLTSYSGNPISAWNLEACLTEGLKTAVDVLSADTPAHPTALDGRKWLCDENGIEFVIAGNGHGSDTLDYSDLAGILTLISKFHQRYAMQSVEFDILNSERKSSVGWGWVELAGYGMRGGNGTA